MMKLPLPESRLLRWCLYGVVLVVLAMPVHALVSTWGGTAIGPLWLWKSWKELLLVGLAVVAIVYLTRHKLWRELARDRLIIAVGLYALLTIALGLIHVGEVGGSATVAGVAMNLRYLLIAVLVYGVFRFGQFEAAPWRRATLWFVAGAGLALAVLGIIQVTVLPADFLERFGYDKATTIAPFTLIDDNPDALRAFATLRGPNDYGAYLIMPLLVVLAVFWRRRRWLTAAGVVLIAVALVLSSSRSAWLGALAAVLALIILAAGTAVWRSKALWAGIVFGLVAGVSLVYAAVTIPALRLAIFHSSPGDSSLTEGSTDAHVSATLGGLERVAANPFGCGPGCAGPASYYGDRPLISENYFVQIAEETGLVGLGLFGVIYGLVGWRLYQLRRDLLARILLASGVGLSVIGLWLHVWSDDPLSLTWWALTGMVLGVAARRTRQDEPNLVP